MGFFENQKNRFKNNPVKEVAKTVLLGLGGKAAFDAIQDKVKGPTVEKHLSAVDGHPVKGWTSGTCPKCGKVFHVQSNGVSVTCPKCGQQFRW